MKLIHKFKSPNFNERKSNKINLIIIHYTALNSISQALEYLCLRKNKVSSHYVISKNGEIYNLVSEKNRAWHAGISYWKGNFDINSNSIGIELDYSPVNNNSKYNNELIQSLIKLLKKLVKKYKIKPHNILGHSEISPYRKVDPGKNFPWNLLEEKMLAFKITKLDKKVKILCLIHKWYIKNKLFSKKKKILFMLNYIGYDTSSAEINRLNFNKIILIYSDRFRYYKNYIINKKNIYTVIELHFLNILLTKLKK